VNQVSKYYKESSPTSDKLNFKKSQDICKKAGMDLVEMETIEKFDAVRQILKDAKSLGSFAGAQQNDTGKWKWINAGEFTYEIHIIDLADSDEESGENEPCLTYDHASNYYTVRECSSGNTNNVICEKIEIAVPKPKFKKFGKYGLKIKF
jgi:hypothetical protein